jgi:hypothetical protein
MADPAIFPGSTNAFHVPSLEKCYRYDAIFIIWHVAKLSLPGIWTNQHLVLNAVNRLRNLPGHRHPLHAFAAIPFSFAVIFARCFSLFLPVCNRTVCHGATGCNGQGRHSSLFQCHLFLPAFPVQRIFYFYYSRSSL